MILLKYKQYNLASAKPYNFYICENLTNFIPELRPLWYWDHIFTDRYYSFTLWQYFSLIIRPSTIKTNFVWTKWWSYYYAFTVCPYQEILFVNKLCFLVWVTGSKKGHKVINLEDPLTEIVLRSTLNKDGTCNKIKWQD